MTSYQKAATQFGSAATAGVAAVRDVTGAELEVCRIRAWFHLVQARIDTPDFVRGADPMQASSQIPGADGKTKTWAEHCAELAESGKALAGTLSALEAYAGALKDAAADDSVALDSGLTGALAADADALAQQISGSAIPKAQALSGPITALANVALDIIRTKKVKDAVLHGDKPVHVLLEGMQSYLTAVKDELGDAQHLLPKIVKQADGIIPVRPAGKIPEDLPGQALALYEFSRVEGLRLEGIGARIDATLELIKALGDAHSKLLEAAASRMPDEEARAYVAKNVEIIVKQINVLRKGLTQ